MNPFSPTPKHTSCGQPPRDLGPATPVATRLSVREMAVLDHLRGVTTRSDYLRGLIEAEMARLTAARDGTPAAKKKDGLRDGTSAGE